MWSSICPHYSSVGHKFERSHYFESMSVDSVVCGIEWFKSNTVHSYLAINKQHPQPKFSKSETMVNLAALDIVTENVLVLSTEHLGYIDERVETVSTLASIIRHQAKVQAELKTELSAEEEAWFVRLRDAVYEADDLIDELLTRKHTTNPDEKSIGCFPASAMLRRGRQNNADPNQRLNQIWGKLDSIAQERPSGLSVEHRDEVLNHRSESRPETASHVNSKDVVGRDDDLNKVVDILLSNSENIVNPRGRFVAIVGSAGIGKTTLAQLIYNDTRVREAFPIRCWISDSANDLNRVFRKYGQQHDTSSSLKKLVIIDDVWVDQFGLSDMLATAIVITTRSERVARYVRRSLYDIQGRQYELKGLSEQSSWQLFLMEDFEKFTNQIPVDYVKICRSFVKKCSNHPVIITTVGKLLYGQHKIKSKINWIRLQKIKSPEGTELSQLPEVMSILRLSYDKLNSPLKCCFSYCAMFPENFGIRKRSLIGLWMAQNYLQLPGQVPETVGEDYFDYFLQNGFFEVVEKDEHGEVISCKIDNLMHQVAKHIASKECVDTRFNNYSGDGIYHIFDAAKHCREHMPTNSRVFRSFLVYDISEESVNRVLQHGTSLRMLDLSNSDIKYLPDSIGRLFLLRYLNLANNGYLVELPSSIGDLHNLQTMDLRFCSSLKELPEELCSLSQLRCLDIFGCDGLTHMPSSMYKLTSLRLLSQFVVAQGKPNEIQLHGQLRDLDELIDLRSCICIVIPTTYRLKRMDVREEYLMAQRHLREVWVRFLEPHPIDDSDERVLSCHQVLLDMLTLSENIQRFILWGYQGTILRAELPFKLVKFELRSCDKLKQLPFLYAFDELRSLKLHGLRNLVFLQDIGTKVMENPDFFPSLEEFELVNAPKLRGIANDSPFPSHPNFFQNLVNIEVRSCEMLEHFPLLSELSHLKSAKFCGLNNSVYLEDYNSGTSVEEVRKRQSSFFSSLERLEIVNASKLKGLCAVPGMADDTGNIAPAISCFPKLKCLVLANLPELRGFFFEKSGDVYTSVDDVYIPKFGCLSELKVSSCPQLMSMPVFPNLESLSASNIHKELLYHLLVVEASSESLSATPRTHKMHTVTILSVNDIECLPIPMLQVESLTVGQCKNLCELALTSDPVSIKQLIIHDCVRLKHISPPFQLLSILEELEINNCPELDWGMKDDDADEGHNASSLMEWQSLGNLRSLKLTNISTCNWFSIGYISSLECIHLSWLWDLRALPDSIEHLPKLRHLSIKHCLNLTVFPESLCRLSTLQMLNIQSCCRLRIPQSVHNKSSQLAIRICP